MLGADCFVASCQHHSLTCILIPNYCAASRTGEALFPAPRAGKIKSSGTPVEILRGDGERLRSKPDRLGIVHNGQRIGDQGNVYILGQFVGYRVGLVRIPLGQQGVRTGLRHVPEFWEVEELGDEGPREDYHGGHRTPKAVECDEEQVPRHPGQS